MNHNSVLDFDTVTHLLEVYLSQIAEAARDRTELCKQNEELRRRIVDLERQSKDENLIISLTSRCDTLHINNQSLTIKCNELAKENAILKKSQSYVKALQIMNDDLLNKNEQLINQLDQMTDIKFQLQQPMQIHAIPAPNIVSIEILPQSVSRSIEISINAQAMGYANQIAPSTLSDKLRNILVNNIKHLLEAGINVEDLVDSATFMCPIGNKWNYNNFKQKYYSNFVTPMNSDSENNNCGLYSLLSANLLHDCITKKDLSMIKLTCDTRLIQNSMMEEYQVMKAVLLFGNASVIANLDNFSMFFFVEKKIYNNNQQIRDTCTGFTFCRPNFIIRRDFNTYKCFSFRLIRNHFEYCKPCSNFSVRTFIDKLRNYNAGNQQYNSLSYRVDKISYNDNFDSIYKKYELNRLGRAF